MKTHLRRLGLATMFLLAGQAFAGDVSAVTPAADGNYTVTVKAHHKFTRNTDKLKAEAVAAATAFCAKEGKQLKVITADETKSMYLMGDFAQVTLTFKALAPGAAETAPAVALAAPPAPAKPMTSDELAAELTKLDDLRKKGLINDAEFDALKHKVISRF